MRAAPWSERCSAYLALAPVRPFHLDRATPWERELFDLTGRRGLPVVGDVAFGADTHAGLEPEPWAEGTGEDTEPFAWSPTLGRLFLRRHGSDSRVSTRTRPVSSRWQNWLEHLVLHARLPAFPPPLVLFDPPSLAGQRHFPRLLAARLGLRQEVASSFGEGPFPFSNDTTFLVEEEYGKDPHRLRTTRVDALREAIEAANDLGVQWYFDSSVFAREPPADDAAFAAATGDVGRETAWGRLSASLDREAVVQRIDLLGQRVQTAVARAAGSVRRASTAALRGSERLRAWARHRGVVRSSLRFDERGLRAWAGRHGVGAAHASSLLALENEWGGLLSAWYHDPIERPYFWFGVAANEEVHLRNGRRHAKDEFEPMLLSCGVEEPLRDEYPFWSWRDHRLVLVGERSGGELYHEQNGALWRSSPLGDAFEVAAGTARAFFERMALEEWLWETHGHWAPVRILARADDAVAAALGLSRLTEASDWALTTYQGPRTWMWQTTKYGPNLAELRIFSEAIGPVLDAVRVARSVCPGAKIRLQNTLETAALSAAMVAAGLSDGVDLSDPSFVDFDGAPSGGGEDLEGAT